MKYFFASLPRTIIALFTGYNLLWNVVAMLLTYLIVISGLDWYYFTHTRGAFFGQLFFPAVIIGAIVPILVPLFLFLDGRKTRTRIAWTLTQAAVVGSLISSFYKALTGRMQPNVLDTVNDISANFDFGFLEYGIFWGWPSSHTTIAFAMSFALIQLFPRNKFVVFFSIFYALYIGIGISFSIHWFSEFAAGAIIGTLIGIIVGKHFKKHFLEAK